MRGEEEWVSSCYVIDKPDLAGPLRRGHDLERIYCLNNLLVAANADLIQVDQHICRILVDAVSADLLEFLSPVSS